ncbi:MAG: pyridoxamine kinase [Roseburia sp.]|nr:pyridoxamine kinase [Roseburia sp.]
MKRIALINDLSGFGKCSLTAAIPVVSALGLQACPLPTAVLSAQTGFPSYYCDDCTDKMNRITDEWSRMDVRFDGIYSGYLENPAQVRNVLYFLSRFHTDGALYLADPIMGDNGQRFPFLTRGLLDGIKTLTRRADVITPNLTELCLLSDTDYDAVAAFSGDGDYTDRIRDIGHRLLERAETSQTIIVTGILRHADAGAAIGNLAVSADDCCYVETPYTGTSFSGTGDLFASVIIGSLVKGLPVPDALRQAVAFLQPAIAEASADNVPRDHGVPFEKHLYRLICPAREADASPASRMPRP